MMEARLMNPSDIIELRAIHEKYFKDEFTFPDFLNGYICPFVIKDENNSVIVGGGIRTLAEVVLVTDKSKSARVRQDALLRALGIADYAAERAGFDMIHAFVQDEVWQKQLETIGFRASKGNALVLPTIGEIEKERKF